jgi:hypothetical protein
LRAPCEREARSLIAPGARSQCPPRARPAVECDGTAQSRTGEARKMNPRKCHRPAGSRNACRSCSSTLARIDPPPLGRIDPPLT